MRLRPSDRAVYNAAQVFLTVVALGIGIVLALPGDTFSLSPTYEILASLVLTEEQWGIVFTGLGVACAISAYFSKLLMARNGDDNFAGPAVVAIYRMLRVTWFVATPVWFFWAGCFLAAAPISLGTVFFSATGGLSLWVHFRVRKEARRNDG
jgi:hypothetical protein